MGVWVFILEITMSKFRVYRKNIIF